MENRRNINRHEITLEEITTCPLCEGEHHSFCFSGGDTLYHSEGEWNIVRCDNCGLMFVTPRPDTASIGQFYPDDYKPYTAPVTPQKSSPLRALAKQCFKTLFNSYETVIPPSIPPGTALEVGCASGRNLIELHQRGWHVSGLEPSQSAVTALKQLDYVDARQGTISSSDYPPGSFDLILASMVIEHLHDPLSDLKKIHCWLKPGGYLSGSIPNSASWEFKYFKGEWYCLHLPHHLCHFTPNTLIALLKASGFDEVTIYHQRNVNNLMVHLGRWFKKKGIPGSNVLLNYPEKGPWWLRIPCHFPAAILCWTRQAGRISFTARKNHA